MVKRRRWRWRSPDAPEKIPASYVAVVLLFVGVIAVCGLVVLNLIWFFVKCDVLHRSCEFFPD